MPDDEFVENVIALQNFILFSALGPDIHWLHGFYSMLSGDHHISDDRMSSLIQLPHLILLLLTLSVRF